MTLREGARNLLPILQVKRLRFGEDFAYPVVVTRHSWGFESGFQVCHMSLSLPDCGMDEESCFVNTGEIATHKASFRRFTYVLINLIVLAAL